MSRHKLRRIPENPLTDMLNITPQLAEYISEHAADNPDRIHLAGKMIHGYPAGFVADQIEARQRYRKRFPQLCADPFTIFPPKLNLEQSSSEATAAFKTEFMKEVTGPVNRIIDLSAGFGVDALAMSGMTKQIILTEPDETIRNITEANFRRLIPGKFSFSEHSAEEFVQSFRERSDWIYLDPSRRKSGTKIFKLEDCSPDPVALTDEMLRIADHVLIKTSPMLDIAEALRQWSCVKEVLIISVSNECREVLYHLTTGQEKNPKIICINLKPDFRETLSFSYNEELSSEPAYSDPLKYIFEPNASVLKAGAFKLIASRFGVFKLAASTHLFTSDKPADNFPGKTFEVIRPLEKTDYGIKANIISRNHPMTTAQIAVKYKIKDGGDDFIIGCSGQQKKFILLTRKVIADQ